MNTVRLFIARTLFAIDKERYWKKDLQLSDSLFYSLFRMYEYIFGRKVGIRRESGSEVFYKNGRFIVKRKFFTLESFLVHYEYKIKETLRSLFSSPELAFASLSILLFRESALPFLAIGAIAYDTASSSTSATTTTLTWSHTVTGSDPLIVYGGVDANTFPTSSSYAGTSGTTLGSLTPTDMPERCRMFFVPACSTGANNVSITWGNSGFKVGAATSYSGTNATGQPNASQTTQSSGNAATITVNNTTADSWLIGGAGFSNRNIVGGSGTTERVEPTQSTGSLSMIDSNGGVATGNQSLNITWSFSSSAFQGGIVGAFSPLSAGGGSTPTPTLLTLGVG